MAASVGDICELSDEPEQRRREYRGSLEERGVWKKLHS
jgi:hypothetical protein